jgi:hypothetical protein
MVPKPFGIQSTQILVILIFKTKLRGFGNNCGLLLELDLF